MSERARGVFIAGTDTGVGKTRIAAATLRALAAEGLLVAAMKPVAAGADPTPEGLRNADAVELARASNVEAPYEQLNPFCLSLPASPHIAARNAGIEIDLALISREFANLAARADLTVVEGAGGWRAPISDSETMADIALTLNLPVVLVVGLRLGCLNHALLTAEAIRASGLPLAGWIANHLQPHFEHGSENIAFLESHLPAPLLGSVAFDISGQTAASACVPVARRLGEELGLW